MSQQTNTFEFNGMNIAKKRNIVRYKCDVEAVVTERAVIRSDRPTVEPQRADRPERGAAGGGGEEPPPPLITHS